MADRRQQGREFWYDFDNQTLWRRTPEMDAAITAAYGAFGGSLDSLAQLFALSFRQPNHPTPFTTAIQAGKQGFLDLAEAQHKIMTKHFGSDAGGLRDALIDFGQGVLFDNRPPRQVTHFVHMMDGTPADFVGYHRWHASIRAAMFFGADAAFYEALCHNIALAWAIQTEANPTIDGQSNPGLPADRLQVLSDFWGNLDLATIDRAFVTFKPAAPKPGDLQPVLTSLAEAAVGTSFQNVQDILNKAAGDGAPLHQDNGRFWNLALSDFRKLTIYGVQVIADKGPDRGANSGLIQALKGEPPFGPDGSFPRMPLNRPPVSPDNIALIQKWIDDGGPDQVKPTGPAPA